MRLRSSTLPKTLIIVFLLLTFLTYFYWSRSPNQAPPTTIYSTFQPPGTANFTLSPTPNPTHWTKAIWQTSRLPYSSLPPEDLTRTSTWTALNPGFSHFLMTDALMEHYVRQKYSGTEMEKVYFEVQDYILRSDLIRYLILLKDGGVYNDLDVGCEKAVEKWVPKKFAQEAGVILGVEVDNDFGPDGRTWVGGEDLFELVNWTIMAKPGQPFMAFLLQRVLGNLRAVAQKQGTSLSQISYTVQEVLATTGPAALTAAFFDYASNITSTNVTYKNFTKIEKPVLMGEVVILPIHAFGAGHQVEWAGFKQDQRKVLVHHYFKGSWKGDHYWGPPAQKDDDKIPENEKADRVSVKDRGVTNDEEEQEEVVTIEQKVLHIETEHAMVMAMATGIGKSGAGV